MVIIAVARRKGGVEKSTIVGNLAAEFDALGRSVTVLSAEEGSGCLKKNNAPPDADSH